MFDRSRSAESTKHPHPLAHSTTGKSDLHVTYQTAMTVPRTRRNNSRRLTCESMTQVLAMGIVTTGTRCEMHLHADTLGVTRSQIPSGKAHLPRSILINPSCHRRLSETGQDWVLLWPACSGARAINMAWHSFDSIFGSFSSTAPLFDCSTASIGRHHRGFWAGMPPLQLVVVF